MDSQHVVYSEKNVVYDVSSHVPYTILYNSVDFKYVGCAIPQIIFRCTTIVDW